MINIDPGKMKMLLIPADDVRDLRLELSSIFCRADKTEPGYCFSLVKIRKEFPRLAELYDSIDGE